MRPGWKITTTPSCGTSRPKNSRNSTDATAWSAVAFPRFLDGRRSARGPTSIRRAELGKLIADPKNEMLAKAFVNRLWAHFIGRGFVNPVDDFGPHNPPSHPELLDKLAEEFKKSGYDVKQLCRWIMAQPGLQPQQRQRKQREARRTRGCSARCSSSR